MKQTTTYDKAVPRPYATSALSHLLCRLITAPGIILAAIRCLVYEPQWEWRVSLRKVTNG
jgi:hypothetical protein